MIKTLLLSASALCLVTLPAGAHEGSHFLASINAAQQTASLETESDRLNLWFEEVFEANIARSPMTQTYLGRKTAYDQLDENTDGEARLSYELNQAFAEEMVATFDFDALDTQAQLSYRLFQYDAEQSARMWAFRDNGYIFQQFSGPQTGLATFLMNQHRIDDVSDAEAFIARVVEIERVMGELLPRFEARFEAGVYPPRWVYGKMIETARNVITGAPFDDSAEDSPLLANYRGKIEALEISDEDKARLISEAETAMRAHFLPAYQRMIATFERHQETASSDDGVWKLPNGEAYYNALLHQYTTTDMSADEIHNLGLAEMDRIHGEMRAIMAQVGFEGSLQDFFEFMRTDPQFTYPNTDEGREAYLSEATRIIDTMRDTLPQVFNTFPEAALDVRRVEPFREGAAGKAFYQRPAPNGSRPGVYYANLRDMTQMPTYQMEALAYHEGIPGHHMQLAIMQELDGIPSFRKFGGYTAYTEGWGLYSEYLPKEMGFYQDPYSDFGRLAMELWRAARLVVDTGIHAKRWTREEAIQYLVENTPNPEGDCIAAIERYIVYPGQATAYKIGMLEILRIREAARTELGEAFDLGEFHDVVLANGAVPLAVLEELVQAWVEDKKG
ncbi:DUF885 domain-containing protein [Woodsholea maritima]|uniref:DUF885 domain-containing protein n=1 Tax=Woodsholea maritima TaxID=240237 RepID=UPI00036C5D85|nr:DUF885 domain-containing protein [Woodsholea maritima]